MRIDAGRDPVEEARALCARARRLVVFTGAGISTESGLPDYRGPDGVWTRQAQGRPPPASPFAPRPSPIGAHEHPARRLVFEESPWIHAEPNAAHLAIAALDRAGRLEFLISQNVDNLHRKSGVDPRRLAELHGNPTIVRCVACWAHFPKESFHAEVLASPAFVPVCRACGGALRSSVVDFGDAMPPAAMEASIAASRRADVFLVVGSSLSVYPAAEMPLHALESGARLVIVNVGPTEHDDRAQVRIGGRAGEIVPGLFAP